MWKLHLFCFLFFNVALVTIALVCRDQNNVPVDWYVIYKLPKQNPHPNKLIEDGLAFMYMTSKENSQWVISEISINDSKSMVANTLSGLYDTSNLQNYMYILYNDQPPNGKTSFTLGHTKGIVMADATEGFWLIHSVPHFPFSLQNYQYPKTGKSYGQNFLCISLDLKNINTVGRQLQYNEPYIFAQYVPESLSNSIPEILKVANNITIKNAPWYNVETLISKGGVTFRSFAKAGKFHKDLYADLVSSQLESDLYVETWPNEPDRLPSNCKTKFQVDNVLSIHVPQISFSFKTTKDHSKWAVSAALSTSKWICIGDINRAETQTLRGGGTACISNENLVGQYQGVVSSLQKCKRNYMPTYTSTL